MSLTVVEETTTRLNRSELAVPASRPALFEKAAKSNADVVFLDLEDSVALDDKMSARKDAIAAIGDIDWGDKTLSLRVNGLDTKFFEADVSEIMERASERLDLLMIPKVGTAEDIAYVEALAGNIEIAKGRTKRVGLEVIIESALGLVNVDAIAASSKRIEALHFGPGDYAASIRARTTGIGAPSPDYGVLTAPTEDPDEGLDGARAFHWGDMWHYPLSRIVVAARANGLRPLDGPYADFKDADGLAAQARRAAALGCEGKWAIHPGQIDAINAIFSPGADEIAEARAILAAMQAAADSGQGAAVLDGRMIDVASVRQAEVLVKKAELIERAG